MQTPTLYLVIPCYNEQEVLPITAAKILEKLESLVSRGKITDNSRILFVDDGSKDPTWRILDDLTKTNPHFAAVKLARNAGHQNALLAGLTTAVELSDVMISMDADLQDDIGAIDAFVDKYLEGFDVVYGVRSTRKKDTFFKRNTALMFYKLMQSMGVDMVYNHADYRLMSKRAVVELLGYREVNVFLRGLVPMIGFPSCSVSYERNERFAGESKYPLAKMIAFAIQGITSLSVQPIRMITTVGVISFCASIASLLYYLALYFMDRTVPGWATVVISIWLLGGLQLLSIGIIGEYIAKTYLETKHRPRFIIESTIISGEKSA